MVERMQKNLTFYSREKNGTCNKGCWDNYKNLKNELYSDSNFLDFLKKNKSIDKS